MSTPQSTTLFPGYARDLPVQCFDLATNKCAYQAADVLSCSVFQRNAGSPAFAPAVSWNIKGGVQTGYDQGQVLVAFTGAQTAQIQPNVPYHLWVYRQLGADNTKTEPIAHLLISTEAQS